MSSVSLAELVKTIVVQAKRLKDKYTDQRGAFVNYACVFSQGAGEYDALLVAARQLGRSAKETPSGSIFNVAPIETAAGPLHLVKIRRPDPTRPERGDADFTVADFAAFKQQYVGQPGFTLIKRPTMEMVELTAPGADVRAYFSHPTLVEQLRSA